VKTVGVDLAADPRRTAVCEIDWVSHAVRSSDRPGTDEVVVAAIVGADAAAIDVPPGWPDEFVDAVLAHRDGVSWPPAYLTPPSDREPLRFRATDRAVQALGGLPLSVSTDRIGVAAMRGARLQHLLREAGVEIDRSGVTGRVVEAYPAAALRQWGLVSQGYKRAANVENLRALVTDTVARCGELAAAATECLANCDDDDLDAFICAVVARAAFLGLTAPPRPEHLAAARREGWIHVPTAPLEVIVGQGAA
jgi:predicted nuclease with RNAse H fold